MTADHTRSGPGADAAVPRDGSPGRGPGPELRVDLFLLAGQFPGADHATTLRRSASYARAAEVAGFDGVWFAEHHFISYGVCPSAIAMAGFVLGATTRLRVGTAAAILSNRHPLALAEEVAMLDAVSGGRFDLGVARGSTSTCSEPAWPATPTASPNPSTSCSPRWTAGRPCRPTASTSGSPR